MALKFFRRHRKWFMILVFAAVISMVFWLAWQSMADRIAAWWADRGDEVVGQIDGRNVTARELGEFAFGLRAAGTAVEVWVQALARTATTDEVGGRIIADTVAQSAWRTLSRTVKDPERIDRRTSMVWLALLDEARRLGLDTPEGEVHDRLQRLRSLGLSEALLSRTVSEIARNRHDLLIQGLQVDMTLASYLQYLYGSFGVPVAPEIRQEFARQDERIKVLLAVFKADDVLADVGTPAENALLEQFGRYKAHLPGQGPGGYGYRIPPKVAIEYLLADPAAFEVEAAEAVSAQDVKDYYEANKDTEFVAEPPAPPAPEKEEGAGADKPAAEADTKEAAGASKDAEGEAKDEAGAAKDGPEAAMGETGATADEPAARAEPKAPEKKYRPLDEVRDDIRRRLVRKAAEQLAHEHLAGSVADITTKRKGIDLRIWADGTRARYLDVPGLHTAEELAAMPGVGRATRGQVSLPDYALQVVELVGPEKARIAQGEISEVFTGPEGKSYAFRVSKVAESREPASLDEVREQVVEDVRRSEAFTLARERAKGLLEAAAKDGFEKAAQDRNVKTTPTEWFPRQHFIPYGGRWLPFPPALPEVGSSPLVIAECFKMLEEGRQRTLVTLGDERMVVVAELVDRKAPRQAAYEQWQPMVAGRVANRLAAEGLQEVLDPDAVQRRMNVVVLEPTPKAREEADAADASTTPEGGADEAGQE